MNTHSLVCLETGNNCTQGWWQGELWSQWLGAAPVSKHSLSCSLPGILRACQGSLGGWRGACLLWALQRVPADWLRPVVSTRSLQQRARAHTHKRIENILKTTTHTVQVTSFQRSQPVIPTCSLKVLVWFTGFIKPLIALFSAVTLFLYKQVMPGRAKW